MKKLLLLFVACCLCCATAHAEIEKKVKVSQNDTTSGFLNGKIVCGSNTTCVENNDGADESLQISALTSGTGVTLDLADDNVNESTSIAEIATINDTYNVITEPSADKMRIDLSQKWPLSHQAVSLQTNGTNASSGFAILGVDASGNAEGAFDVATQAELNAFVPATATALAANGANCGSGNSPLGVDATGVVEGCFDVEEEAQLGTTNITGNASDDTILNGTGSSAATWKSIPACTDTAGNHLNYDAATNTFSCGTTGGGSGYNTIQDEGGSLTQRSTVDFIGSGIICSDSGTKTTCTVTTGVASAYNQLQEEGSNITARATLNFIGAGFTVADNATKSELTLNTDLNGIATLNTNGIPARTSAGTYAARTLTGPAAGFSITNGDGVSGNPTFALTNDLSALEGLSSTGIAVRSASDTWVQRSVAGTTNEITVTNGSGVSGDPTLSIPTIFDLSGKTTFKIPTGTAPTVNAAGTIAEDTTASQLLYGATPNVISPFHTACFTVTDLTAADDNMQVYVADRDITVTQVGCRYEGTGSTVATIALENSKTGTGMTHTAPTCVTGNNTATFQSVTANNAIAAGDGIRFDTTNTPSPTTDDYTICFRWTEDRK